MADSDWEWHSAEGMRPQELLARYAETCERNRAVVAGATGLDQLSVRPLGRHHSGGRLPLLWLLLHLIEETPRHAGHAGLLREAVDGATGW